jgi:L-2-amino-thiazoline-4-carboxylic acid hydrolase
MATKAVDTPVQERRAVDNEKPRLTLLEQREVEARIVGPLVRAFAREVGQERALAIVREVIRELARQSGSDLARILGEQTLDAFAGSLDRWRENGALEIDVLEQSAERLSFNVTRCRYAEMYRSLGLADLGASLSCQRDYALAQGFNAEIELTRTQTIMEGAPFCDFRFKLPVRGIPAATDASDTQSRSQSENAD